MNRTENKITVTCPHGHRLRGATGLVGKTVKCPKCKSQFVFAPTDGNGSAVSEKNPTPKSPVRDRSAVTDTGVMRILGDMHVDTQTHHEQNVAVRPCPRCAVPIPETASVCSHCNCYVGVLPGFMRHLMGSQRDMTNN